MTDPILNNVVPSIIEFVKAEKQIILSFSGGKDSLAAMCVLEAIGTPVQMFYMQMIPGLSFVDEYLEYLEEVFGQKIMRVQHPQLYHWLRTYGGQPPHRRFLIDIIDMPEFDYPDVEQGVRRTLKLHRDTWSAVGTKIADSPNRRNSFKKYGWKRLELHKFYPVYNFKKADLINSIKRRGVLVAPDYEIFGRSYDGFDYRYLDGMRSKYPEDYRKVLEWLPLIAAEFHRVDWARKRGIATVT